MSARTCGFDSRPRHHFRHQVSPNRGDNLKNVRRALVAQWIERSPAKAEVVGSNPAKRAISYVVAALLNKRKSPRHSSPPSFLVAVITGDYLSISLLA